MSSDVIEDSYRCSTEDIQIALAPYIQTFLSQTGRRHSCCSVMLPVAFERSAQKSWIDPRFDSIVLEEQYRTSVFPQIRLRFRFALVYILLCSLVWLLYFITGIVPLESWHILCTSLALVIIFCSAILYLSYTKYYRRHPTIISAVTAITISATALCFLAFASKAFSPLGHFAICIEIIILIYTVIPLPLWQGVGIAAVYSITFEILTYFLQNYYHFNSFITNKKLDLITYKTIGIRILLQLCLHLIGCHVLIMNVVRMRGTFMKVGQNLLVRRQLEMEKQLKEKMIHSVMPPKVADMLLKETTGPPIDTNDVKAGIRLRTSNDVKSLFRPFHMHSMDNVSILFADIVGFTKMSSKQTAEQLVEILNDLFERFDDLCRMHGCEKISTLGDCYYCVSGCPEPRPDHAICCVEMGLGMITAMQVFDAQRHEGVKMRVGVHTGSVLCGIVGTRRVKFDVWSNDVSLANRMESTGRPEQVHISEETCSFLGDSYVLEEGDEVFGHRTYFVIEKKKPPHRNSMYSSRNELMPPDSEYMNGVPLSRSTLNITSILPSGPPTSPVQFPMSASLNPSPILSTRARISSFSKVTKFLSSRGGGGNDINKNCQQPKIIVTAKSLPGSLDSDEEEGCCRGTTNINSCSKKDEDEALKQLKTISKFKNWKVPKFLRKTDSNSNNEIKINISDKNPEEVPCLEQNGYYQLPVVMETARPSCHMLEIPSNHHHSSNSSSPKDRDNFNENSGQFSMFDDIIDVKSYISQSRSDISPFARSGSYRSQCGRSPNSDVSPIDRPRSSTVTSRSMMPGPSADMLSVCPSIAASRKDSGIRSNSRRSSIQQQIYSMNKSALSQNRVSGYFTSSQSSISGAPEPVNPSAPQHPDPLAACLQQLRKQSDLQLIKCVRDNARSQRNYLMKPPLSKISLFFKSNEMEIEFRSKAHRFGTENEIEGPPTLATPRYNTFIDCFIGILIYFAIATSLFLLSPSNFNIPYRIWVCLFVGFSFIQCFILFICSRQICRSGQSQTNETFIDVISGWYIWHICGAVVMALPTISVLVTYSLREIGKLKQFEYHYGFLLFICIIHFCNFTQLNCWLRNFLALLAAVSFIAITIVHCTIVHLNQYKVDAEIFKKYENITAADTTSLHQIDWLSDYRIEIILDLILLLLLIWFLNREFEIGYRLSFYGSAVANQDKSRVQNMKNQADMLLHNIIPKHVAEHLKNTAKYSENHHNIGIIFASIVNFNELYDESYLGGKEYLRVLNELIGDFDELLSRSEFRCIEKIKTIGSTFMAASGLDPSCRGNENHHIYALLDFSIAMQSVVDSFNKDLLEFNLILRIGFNIGDVTAGVIGTSKLYYDIWGDAVNVASRMDSTGVPGRIQVGKDCLIYLEEKFDFEARGKVYVKGKDHMEVYLMKGRKPDSIDDIGDDMSNGCC